MYSSDDQVAGQSPLPPDRWRRIEALYAATADQPRDQRSAFLDKECMGDAELRREVESLLLASEEADGFLTPAHLGKHIRDLSASVSSLVGDNLGRYEILSRIGAGAMGEVYAARDRDTAATPNNRSDVARRRRSISVLTRPATSAVGHYFNSRNSQARARLHSRCTVLSEVCKTSAVSSSLRPPKNRSSTI